MDHHHSSSQEGMLIARQHREHSEVYICAFVCFVFDCDANGGCGAGPLVAGR